MAALSTLTMYSPLETQPTEPAQHSALAGGFGVVDGKHALAENEDRGDVDSCYFPDADRGGTNAARRVTPTQEDGVTRLEPGSAEFFYERWLG
jgi:hypothetical protein